LQNCVIFPRRLIVKGNLPVIKLVKRYMYSHFEMRDLHTIIKRYKIHQMDGWRRWKKRKIAGFKSNQK
jgi:hypothetical protein